MLIAVVVVFLVCWGPKLIFDVISKMAPEILFYDEVFKLKVSLWDHTYMYISIESCPYAMVINYFKIYAIFCYCTHNST
jgi:hypothetical protein